MNLSPSLLRRSGALVLCVALATPARALDPYRSTQPQQQNGQDLERLSRPRTNTLPGGDVREFRDRMGAMRQLTFREGAGSGGAFRATALETSKGRIYEARASLGQFSESVQSQIASRFPAARESGGPLLVRVVPTETGGVSVISAQPDTSSRESSRPAVPRAAPNIVVPGTGELGLTQHKNAFSGVMPAAQPATQQVAALPAGVAVPRVFSSAVPSYVGTLSPVRVPAGQAVGVAQVQTLSRDAAIRPVAAPAAAPRTPDVTAGVQTLPAAVLPAIDGVRLVVLPAPDSSTGRPQVEVRGTIGQFPPLLQAQIDMDQPAALTAGLSYDTPVRAVLTLNSDKSITVSSIERIGTAAQPPTVEMGPPVVSRSQMVAVAPGQVAAAPAGAGASAQSASDRTLSAGDPISIMSTVAVGETPRLAAAAATVTEWLGADPRGIEMASRPLSPAAHAAPVPAAVVAVDGGREIAVMPLGRDAGGTPVYRAEGRLGDMSLDLKAQVSQILSEMGGDAALEQDAAVMIDFTRTRDGRPEVTAIHVQASAETKPARPVTLWARVERTVVAPVAALPRAEAPVKPGAVKKPAPPVVINAFAPRPALAARRVPAKTGLSPSLSAVVQAALGWKGAEQETVKVEPEGGKAVVKNRNDKTAVQMRWRFGIRPGHYQFSILDKNDRFRDTVREQVDALLKALADKGEEWAKEALKGRAEVQVNFEAVPRPDGKTRVEVRGVGPRPEVAAEIAAKEAGLMNGDYTVMSNGEFAALVLDPGAKGEFKGAASPVRLTSPDGGVRVFVKPAPSAADGLVLYLSHASLVANRNALALASGDTKAMSMRIKQAADANAPAYLVRLDPQPGADAYIKPIQAPVPTGPQPGAAPLEQPVQPPQP